MSSAFVALEYLVTVVFALIDSAEHRVVLFRLFYRADPHGARMFPSIELLARECRREPIFVEGVIHDAIARGVIEPYVLNGRRAYRTTIDLILWIRSGKPVDILLTTHAKSLIADPQIPRSPDPQDPQAGARAGALPPEVVYETDHTAAAARLADVRAVQARVRARAAPVQSRRRPQRAARGAE